MKTKTTLAILGAGLLFGCAQAKPDHPRSLDQLVIEDPSFTFSTSAVVGVDVGPQADATGPVELRTTQGGLVLQGGFRDAARVNLRLPLNTTHLLKTVGANDPEVVDVVVGDSAAKN